MSEAFVGLLIDPEHPELDGELHAVDGPRLTFPILPPRPWRAAEGLVDHLVVKNLEYRYVEAEWTGPIGKTGFWVREGQEDPLDFVFSTLCSWYQRSTLKDHGRVDSPLGGER